MGGGPGELLRYKLPALILWRKVLGERAHRCIADLEDIGDSLREMGQFDAAAGVLDRVVALRRQSVGEQHPAYAQALWKLGGTAVRWYRLQT